MLILLEERTNLWSIPIRVLPGLQLRLCHGHTSPRMIRESIDQRSHSVLGSKANVVHAMFEAEDFLKGSADPFEDLAFSSTGQALDHMT